VAALATPAQASDFGQFLRQTVGIPEIHIPPAPIAACLGGAAVATVTLGSATPVAATACAVAGASTAK
jgi:hypothetical protein